VSGTPGDRGAGSLDAGDAGSLGAGVDAGPGDGEAVGLDRPRAAPHPGASPAAGIAAAADQPG
jgi:hypothetical protein